MTGIDSPYEEPCILSSGLKPDGNRRENRLINYYVT